MKCAGLGKISLVSKIPNKKVFFANEKFVLDFPCGNRKTVLSPLSKQLYISNGILQQQNANSSLQLQQSI